MDDELLDEIKAIVADPTQAPQLHDRLHGGAARLIERILDAAFDPGAGYSDEELARRVAAYEDAAHDLARAVALVSYFGDPTDRRTIPGLISRLANASVHRSGQSAWLDLERYPAVLVFYTAGLAAVAGSREEILGPIFLTPGVPDSQHALQPNVLALYPAAVVEHQVAQRLPGLERHHTPMSDRLHEFARPALDGLVFDDESFDRAFDRFEFLLGLVVSDIGRGDGAERIWGPIGRFAWRARYGGGVTEQMHQELENSDPKAPLLRGGLFKGDAARLKESAALYRLFVARAHFF